MKCKVIQEIDSEVPGKPHKVGTVIEHKNAWILCEIFRDGNPVAEPADDEAREAVKPGIERRKKVRETLERQAAEFAQRAKDASEAEESLRTSEFEKTLLEGT